MAGTEIQRLSYTVYRLDGFISFTVQQSITTTENFLCIRRTLRAHSLKRPCDSNVRCAGETRPLSVDIETNWGCGRRSGCNPANDKIGPVGYCDTDEAIVIVICLNYPGFRLNVQIGTWHRSWGRRCTCRDSNHPHACCTPCFLLFFCFLFPWWQWQWYGKCKYECTIRDFRLPQLCRWGHRSSRLLRHVCW